jgi:hypothetical protein
MDNFDIKKFLVENKLTRLSEEQENMLDLDVTGTDWDGEGVKYYFKRWGDKVKQAHSTGDDEFDESSYDMWKSYIEFLYEKRPNAYKRFNNERDAVYTAWDNANEYKNKEFIKWFVDKLNIPPYEAY